MVETLEGQRPTPIGEVQPMKPNLDQISAEITQLMIGAAQNEAAIQPLVKKIWAAFDEAKAKRTPISVEGATNKTAWTKLAGKPKMRYCQYLVRDGSRKRGANDDTHSVRVTVNLDRATHAIIGGERYPIVKSALHRGVIHVSVGESETLKPVKKEEAKPVKHAKQGGNGNGSKKTHFVRDGYLACHPRADVGKFASTTVEGDVTCKICREEIASHADTEKWAAEIDALRAEWTKDGDKKWKHADGRTIQKMGRRYVTFDKHGLTIDGGTKGEQPQHLLEAMRKQREDAIAPAQAADDGARKIVVPMTETQRYGINDILGGSFFDDDDAMRDNYGEFRPKGMDDKAFDGWLEEHYCDALALDDNQIVIDTTKAMWEPLVDALVLEMSDDEGSYPARYEDYADEAKDIGLVIRINGESDQSMMQRRAENINKAKKERKLWLTRKNALLQLGRKLEAAKEKYLKDNAYAKDNDQPAQPAAKTHKPAKKSSRKAKTHAVQHHMGGLVISFCGKKNIEDGKDTGVKFVKGTPTCETCANHEQYQGNARRRQLDENQRRSDARRAKKEENLREPDRMIAAPDAWKEAAQEPRLMHRRRSKYTVCGEYVQGLGGENAVYPRPLSTHDRSKVTCPACIKGDQPMNDKPLPATTPVLEDCPTPEVTQ